MKLVSRSADISSTPIRLANRRVVRRLLPFLCLLYFVAYLDRVNISFASLEMTHELKMNPEQYGFGAGVFYVGYLLLEIPGALLVESWSARKWIARIMVSWGIISSGTALITNTGQFYTMRFLLGAAEAGFYPAILVYLSHWFRKTDRARAIALFMTAIPLSEVIGGPISGLLMQIHWFGWAGWRWLLIFEGFPAIVIGALTLLIVPDRPRDARWLRNEERDGLEKALALEVEATSASPNSTWTAIRHRKVLLLAAAYFFLVNGNIAFQMWLPKILQEASGAGAVAVGFMVAIPFIADIPIAFVNAWHSDITEERRLHVAVPMFLGAGALAAATLARGDLLPLLVLLSIATMALHAYRGPFWALPATFLSGRAAAASVGLINCFGNVGAFVGPWTVGILRKASADLTLTLGYMACSAFLTGLLVLMLGNEAAKQRSS